MVLGHLVNEEQHIFDLPLVRLPCVEYLLSHLIDIFLKLIIKLMNRVLVDHLLKLDQLLTSLLLLLY